MHSLIPSRAVSTRAAPFHAIALRLIAFHASSFLYCCSVALLLCVVVVLLRFIALLRCYFVLKITVLKFTA